MYRKKNCMENDTGYPHDGRADKQLYRHDGGADSLSMVKIRPGHHCYKSFFNWNV